MPIPPITTTTKQTMSTCVPMPGYTDETGAASIPASAASATPSAKTRRYTRSMSIPSDCTISRWDAPARMVIPTRVRWMRSQRRPATARHTPDMNSRYTG